MSTYPSANRRDHWHQDSHPGAKIVPNCGVIHTTEGTSLPGYQGGATAPNYTARPNIARKRLDWFAHFEDQCSSRALRNLAGGVETNTANALQVELVGTCDPGTRDAWERKGLREGEHFIFWPDAPVWALKGLAEFVAWAKREHGIPIAGPPGAGHFWTAYPTSYANGGGQRMTGAQWRKFKGWCGHQHVPENVHGDPGRLPWGRVKIMAEKINATPKAKVTPNWDAIHEAATKVAKRATGEEKADALVIAATARRYSTKH